MRGVLHYVGATQLTYADLRESSCTDAAIGILNRQSASLFGHPGFQLCTDGLVDLFATHKSPSDILSCLCSTLLRISDFTALHIVPTTRHISSHHTPFPEVDTDTASSRLSITTAYRPGGVGAIYGRNVHSVDDSVKKLRRAVKNLPLEWQIKEDRANGIERKRVYSDWDKEGGIKRVRQAWKEEYKPKPKYFKVEERRTRKEPEIKGNPRFMLVRMLDDGWEDMTWRTSVQSGNSAKALTTPSFGATQVRSSAGRSVLDDLTKTAKQTPPKSPFQPNRSSSPASSPLSDHIGQPPTKRPSLNPFRTSSSQQSGVRPLSQSVASASTDSGDWSTSSSQKRRFGGADTAEKKRAGMRMFTVKR